MIKKIDIKKELTEEEFKDIITVCEREFEQVSDIATVALGCEEKTKGITPAKEVYILLPKLESKEFEIITLDKKIPMKIDKESVISECYNTKQPLIVNDVTQSFLYKEKYDSFLEFEIKDLLVVPVLDDSAQKDILAILWAAIPKGSWNQYTQKDLEYMARFSIFIKRFLQQKELVDKEDVSDAGFADCMEAYDNLNAKIRREQEYFSSIIHDIRTPMNGVLGFLELLQLNETDPKKKEYIETALKSGESMVALIGDALDVSKISSGKMSIEKVEFSVLDELSDVAKLFYNSARKKEITLSAFYDPNLPQMIHSDFHRIKQIINNLLNNAIKFTPNKGNIALELIYDKKRDGLTVSIKDSGIGVAKERQKDIFTPYTQEKSSTSREYGGTGLGLSISQQLSVLLGGKMELESEEGKGSKFYFTIPCNTDKDTPSCVDKKKLKKHSVMIYDSKNSNIAIDTAKRYLEDFDLDVKKTKRNESLESMRSNKFDILVILKEDTLSHEENIQGILDAGKSVIIVEDGHFEDEHNWFVGKIGRVSSLLLPQDLFHTILEFTAPVKKRGKEDFSALEQMKDKHILVVDDNAINLKFMKEILKVLNIESISAQSGKEALEKFENEKLDMIFMDENMPGMQGTEAIKHIRKIEKKKKLNAAAIIGLTGDADKKTKGELLNAGANDVLTKPIQLKEITSAIGKYL